MTSQIAQDSAMLLLTSPPKLGYEALLRLEKDSEAGPEVSAYWEQFLDMLNSPNGYVRFRALVLLARNARWVDGQQAREGMNRYLNHLTDPKPIVTRRAIQELEHWLAAKPEFADMVRDRFQTADFTVYPDSMAPLVQKDALKLLAWMDKTLKENG